MSQYYDDRMRDFDRAQQSYDNQEPFEGECEYCNHTDIIAGEGNHDDSITADLRLDVEDYNSLDVIVCVNGSTLFDFSVDINYCPMCGRKLEVE